MTGYASKTREFEDYTVLAEIKSLNNKYLELNFKLPFYLGFMEERLRRKAREYIKRGTVDISIKVVTKEKLVCEMLKQMLNKYCRMLQQIKPDTDIDFRISLSEIINLKELLNPEDTDVAVDIPAERVESVFINAIDEFQKSRYEEGEHTKEDLLSYIGVINSSLKNVEKLYPEVIEKYKKQLREKIQELVTSGTDENRIMMEVGIFANKVDISEEISRINGHIKKMTDIIHSYETCGRELDFILQELNREFNTVGAKVPDYTVSEEVVNVKSYLDKIKEQVRNIE